MEEPSATPDASAHWKAPSPRTPLLESQDCVLAAFDHTDDEPIGTAFEQLVIPVLAGGSGFARQVVTHRKDHVPA